MCSKMAPIPEIAEEGSVIGKVARTVCAVVSDGRTGDHVQAVCFSQFHSPSAFGITVANWLLFS